MNSTANTNPWLGWASYTESDAARFVGRRAETNILYTLITGYTLVTLYGRSGSGKSSLLKAGVFPMLRTDGMVPVQCRFDRDADCLSVVRGEIERVCRTMFPDGKEPADLYHYLTRTRFTDPTGRRVVPVIVMDQFEDSLRNPPEGFSDLLRDINDIVLNMSDAESPVRFVISIREDYLYLLEDTIDNCGLSGFKSHRMRLQNFSREAADSVLDLGDYPADVRGRLLELSLGPDGRYSPVLLSFYASELFLAVTSSPHTPPLSLLADGSGLIRTYYDRTFHRRHGILSAKAREFVETSMQHQGLRAPVEMERARRHLGDDTLAKLLDNGPAKLLQKYQMGDKTYVELIHDRLAEEIYARARQADNSRLRHRLLVLTSVIFLTLLFVGINTNISNFDTGHTPERLELTPGQRLAVRDYVRELTLLSTDTSDWNLSDFRSLRTVKVKGYQPDRLYVSATTCPSLNSIAFTDTLRRLFLRLPYPASSSLSVTLPPGLESLTVSGFDGRINFVIPDGDSSFFMKGDILWQTSDNTTRIVHAPKDAILSVEFPAGCADSTKYYPDKELTFVNSVYLSEPFEVRSGSEWSEIVLHRPVDLIVPDSIRTLGKIHNAQFLKSVTFPRDVRVLANAFVGCDSLEKVTFAKGDCIETGAFWICPALREVHLADTMTMSLQPFNLASASMRYILPDTPTEFSLMDGYLFHGGDLPVNVAEPHASSLSILDGVHMDGDRLKYKNWTLSRIPDGNPVWWNKCTWAKAEWRFMGNQLEGITDIHLLAPREINPVAAVPLEVRNRITLHIPHGTSSYFTPDELDGFRSVEESPAWRRYTDVIAYQASSMLDFWRNHYIIVGLVVLTFCAIPIMFRSVRGPLRKIWLYIPIGVIGALGLNLTLFFLIPPTLTRHIAVSLAVTILSILAVLAVLLWIAGFDRRRIMEWREKAPGLWDAFRLEVQASTAATLDFIGRHRPAIILLFIIAALAGIALKHELDARSRLHTAMNAFGAGRYREAWAQLPSDRFLLPGTAAQVDALTDSLISKVLPRPPLPGSIIADRAGLPHGLREWAMSPDTTMIALVDENWRLMLFSYPEGRHLYTLPPDGHSIQSVNFSPDSRRLVFCKEVHADGSDNARYYPHILDLGSFGLKPVLSRAAGKAFALNDGIVVSGGRESYIISDSGNESAPIEGRDITMTPDRRLISMRLGDNLIYVKSFPGLKTAAYFNVEECRDNLLLSDSTIIIAGRSGKGLYSITDPEAGPRPLQSDEYYNLKNRASGPLHLKSIETSQRIHFCDGGNFSRLSLINADTDVEASYLGDGYLLGADRSLTRIASDGRDTTAVYPQATRVKGSDYIAITNEGRAENPFTGDVISYPRIPGNAVMMSADGNRMVIQALRRFTVAARDGGNVNPVITADGDARSLSADGSTLTYVNGDTLSVYDLDNGRVASVTSSGLRCLRAGTATGPDGTTRTLAIINGELKVFDAGMDEIFSTRARVFHIDHAGRRLFLGVDNAIDVLSLDGLTKLYSFRVPGLPSCVTLSPDGARLLVTVYGSVFEYALPTRDNRKKILRSLLGEEER